MRKACGAKGCLFVVVVGALLLLAVFQFLGLSRVSYLAKTNLPFPSLLLWQDGAGLMDPDYPRVTYWVLTDVDELRSRLPRVFSSKDMNSRPNLRGRFDFVGEREAMPENAYFSLGRLRLASWEMVLHPGRGLVEVITVADAW